MVPGVGPVKRAGIRGLILCAFLLVGCAPRTVSPGLYGLVRLGMQPTRHAQYVASEVRAYKVTISEVASTARFVQHFSPEALKAGPFAFGVLNLPLGSYVASVEAFADGEALRSVGQSVSSPFAVGPGTEAVVAMPPLVLVPTPVGDWRIQVSVALAPGYKITEYRFALNPTSGESQTETSPANVLTWGDVAAFPSGVSTTSITVTAKKGNSARSSSALATVSILPDATVSTAVALAIP